jgi:PKD repeat protein
VAGSVPTPGSQAPVAAISATPTSGTVPLTASFSSAGSSDPDGSIVAYEWNFGDGSAVVTGSTASHVYGKAGSYNAQLKLTDNSGLTATRSVTITAQAPVVLIDMRVADIAMKLTVNKSRTARADATVKVLDASGSAVPGATITGTWSGIVAGNVSGITASNGVVTLASPNTKASGTFTFTVTGVSLSGYSYNSTLNTETRDAISR